MSCKRGEYEKETFKTCYYNTNHKTDKVTSCHNLEMFKNKPIHYVGTTYSLENCQSM